MAGSLGIPSLREGMESSDYWRNLTEGARAVMEESEMDPDLALEFWCRWLVDRSKRNFDSVVLITGDEGTGKSTLALKMALRCAKLAGYPDWGPTEVCYSGLDLIHAYQKAQRGRPVWYDEGVRGTFAGEQMTPEQRAIVKALALVRESGAILFALYPSIWMAAKQIRGRRACLWIHVVHRGLGRVHERDRRLNYLPTDSLGLTISPRAPHVAWHPYAENSSLWTTYLATKKAKLREFLEETERDLKVPKGQRSGEVARPTEPSPPVDTAERKRAATRARVERWRARKRAGIGVDKGTNAQGRKNASAPTVGSASSTRGKAVPAPSRATVSPPSAALKSPSSPDTDATP